MAMKIRSRVLMVCGTVLLVTVLVSHIVCLISSYQVEIPLKRIPLRINDTVEEERQKKHGMTGEQVKKLSKEGSDALWMGNTRFHYGFWEICLSGTMPLPKPQEGSVDVDSCFSWGSSLPPNISFEPPGWIKHVRVFYFAGLMLISLAVVMAIGSSLTTSRGDRLRILPVVICITSIWAGLVILVGNIILGINHKEPALNQFALEQDAEVRKMVSAIIGGLSTLTWAFYLDTVLALLAILAGVVYALSGILARKDARKSQGQEQERVTLY